MGRGMIVFLLQAAVLMPMLLQPVIASDGDVDYSAPYITVDPKTGQLVTRNPGPHLKTHSMNMSGQNATDQPVTVTSAAANSSPMVNTTIDQSTVEDAPTVDVSMIAIIVAGVLTFGALAARKFRQKH